MIRLFQFLLLFFLIVVSYIAVSYLFSLFPANGVNSSKVHTVYVYSNDELFSHTEIIMDIAPFQKEFVKAFPKLLPKHAKGYVAFSYGDRDFMLDEGGFEDLNLTLALRSLFINTPALVKVGYYSDFAKQKAKKILLSPENLTILKSSILNTLVRDEFEARLFAKHKKHWYVHYYKANRAYNLFHTCNTWTGDRLREAGLKMGYWTPFAQNVTSQFN